ncbi:UxaA family hydrolase [Paenibacillus humicola]|uniref:UxaA family hydrolase n=1 Tax=Paenibacillus humicola TaxID=3110540 RepID=UPI00237B3453|nr:altronate dehydratase family protein [Paenibacillus humicola]
MNDWIRLHPSDHVVVALRTLAPGETIDLGGPGAAAAAGVDAGSTEAAEFSQAEGSRIVTVLDEVPKGHKLLTKPVRQGEHILKFGYSIGVAKDDLQPGSWLHTHNIGTGLKGMIDYTYEPVPPAVVPKPGAERTFQGYIRENGEAGIRNEIWIVNTVGCINKTCETLARMGSSRFGGRVDGVYHFAHPFGCSQLGDDLTYTQKLLASLVRHPNAAGVLVVGLGCENNQIESFKQAIGGVPEGRVLFLKSQEAEDELEEGLELLEQLVRYAERFKRGPVPVSKLRIGLKCGGSDGLSGITANPLVGRVADWIVAEGGSAILTEVPEMFGAETILMNRAQDEEVFGQIVHLINDFKHYFIRHNQEIYENPSPGNKDGGISTLEEKSLGCTQKGGRAQVSGVWPYGERIGRSGLNLVEAPGNDLVSVTALAAAGAHVVLFTTGRGTPFGGPVPTVKISTNSELAQKKRNWIDFNAGRLLEDRSMEQLGEELVDAIVAVASGEEQTMNERNGFREIAIFKDGVIL